MELIQETIYEAPYRTRAFDEYFGKNWCVLDIETTGLSPKTSKVILIGLVFPQEDSLRAVQLFAHSRQEEEEILLKLNDLLRNDLTIVTYNGASFDLPYLEYRYRQNRIEPSWMPCAGLDMYRVARYHSPLKQILPNLRQKSVEVYMDLSDDRADEIDGAESVRLYEEYETFSNPEDRERILLHNRDDIVQLSRLLKLLDKLDLHRIVYYEALSAERESGEVLVVKKITPMAKELNVEGIRRADSPDYYGFASGYTANLHGGKFKLTFPGETLEGHFVVSLADIFEDEWDDVPRTLLASPFREGDYLILASPGEVHCREVNELIRTVLGRL